LAALTAEVRQLRVAVEESTRTQVQSHAIGMSLSAQQSRISVIGSRLEAVRNELLGATARRRDAEALVANAQRELAQVADPAERAQGGGMYQLFKQQADRAVQVEEDLRRRASDLFQSLQVEEQRWSDLMARLEQATKK
jgi:hypothetical protein